MKPQASLAALRFKCGLTQKEIAELARISISTIIAIENHQRALTVKVAARVSFVTGINLLDGDLRPITKNEVKRRYLAVVWGSLFK